MRKKEIQNLIDLKCWNIDYRRKSRILLIWNVETLIIPLSISGSIKLIKLHFSCQALVRASMFISRHHTGGSFQKKHNCQNENYFCDLEYDLILSLAWATGMYSPPKPLWAETVRRSHQWHLGSDFWDDHNFKWFLSSLWHQSDLRSDDHILLNDFFLLFEIEKDQWHLRLYLLRSHFGTLSFFL